MPLRSVVNRSRLASLVAVLTCTASLAVAGAVPAAAAGPAAAVRSAASAPGPQVLLVTFEGMSDVTVRWRKSAGASSYQVALYKVLDPKDKQKGSFRKNEVRLKEIRRTDVRPDQSGLSSQAVKYRGLDEQAVYLAQAWAFRHGSAPRLVGQDLGITGAKDRYLRCALPAATFEITRVWSKTSLVVVSNLKFVPLPVRQAAEKGGNMVDWAEVAMSPDQAGQYALKVGVTVGADRQGSKNEKRVVRGMVGFWDAAVLLQDGVSIADRVDKACR